jgi:carbon monoxide dehydrogenase subunit G
VVKQTRAEELAVAVTFSGEFTSPRTPDEVYDFLCDANKFGPLLPDFESMSVEDATHFTVKLRVEVGNIRGAAEIKMELSQAVRPSRAQYQGRGIAVGSQIAISTGFDLSPLAEGTRIAWQGEASVSGKLAFMASSVLEPLSKKNLEKLIDGLRCALTYPPTELIAQPAPIASVEAPSSAEQPVQAPQQELPGEAEQGAPAEPPPQSAAENCPD